MSRDQIVTALLACGEISLIRTIEDIEAGRARRIRLDPLRGDPALTRAVIEFLRSLGADVEIARPVPSLLRSVG